MPRILTMSFMAVLAVPGLAWAQAAATAGSGDLAKALAVLAAGLGFGLAAGLCGIGQGRAAGQAVDAMARLVACVQAPRDRQAEGGIATPDLTRTG